MTDNNNKYSKNIPDFFINAFYESKFRDSTFVIKAGGQIVDNKDALDNLIANIRELILHDIKIVLIYGHGKIVDRAVEERGVGGKRENGRRITDQATMDIIKQVVGGDLSLHIYQTMYKNKLDGLSLNAIPADWMHVEMRPKEPIDYGLVGDIKEVYSRPISRILKYSNFIACPCIAMCEDGNLVNINADTIATELAIGIKADKLIFLSDVDGVKIDGKPAFIITSEQIPKYIEDGTITDGMKVKMENCLRALKADVKRIHLINGLRENALHNEIYESIGPGTMILKESERENYLNEIEVQKKIEAIRDSKSA